MPLGKMQVVEGPEGDSPRKQRRTNGNKTADSDEPNSLHSGNNRTQNTRQERKGREKKKKKKKKERKPLPKCGSATTERASGWVGVGLQQRREERERKSSYVLAELLVKERGLLLSLMASLG